MVAKEARFKPSLLDYAIMGLIQDTPQSGYSIRMMFETTALGVFSSSPGSIYPALKRLQKNAWIGKKSVKDSNKYRFYLTPTGGQFLNDWLLLPILKVDVEKNREELLLKFAFMENLLTIEQKLGFLESFSTQLKIYLQELKAFQEKEAKNMPIHGRLSFEHGIATAQTTLNWCRKTIKFFKNKST